MTMTTGMSSRRRLADRVEHLAAVEAGAGCSRARRGRTPRRRAGRGRPRRSRRTPPRSRRGSAGRARGRAGCPRRSGDGGDRSVGASMRRLYAMPALSRQIVRPTRAGRVATRHDVKDAWTARAFPGPRATTAGSRRPDDCDPLASGIECRDRRLLTLTSEASPR